MNYWKNMSTTEIEDMIEKLEGQLEYFDKRTTRGKQNTAWNKGLIAQGKHLL